MSGAKKDNKEIMTMFNKFKEAIEMDQKGTPRNVIIHELGISSATFYKWVKDPDYWANKYSATPQDQMSMTKNIIREHRMKESSIEVVRELVNDLNINDYELEFIYHFITYRNGTEAMLMTLSKNTSISRHAAGIKAVNMLKKPHIRSAIDRILLWEMEGMHLTLKNDIVGQLYKMAFYDPAMFIDEKGNTRFKSIDEVPAEYRCCIKGIKANMHPKNPGVVSYEITLVDRKDAMRELSKYTKLYENNEKGLGEIGKGLEKIAKLVEKNKNITTLEQRPMKTIKTKKVIANGK